LSALAPSTAAVTRQAPGTNRVRWLDGIRGGAALFVVLHHIWMTTWPGYPSNTGPWWLGWLLFGHMAVAIFIVVSGFSLALAPMSKGGKLAGGVRRFVRRRAWRILPAYWAALILSIVVTAVLLRPELDPAGIVKSLGVHGLLLQDVVGSESPNGALWSIAIEWQIYFVFPLLLWLGRKTSLATAVLITTSVVLVAHAVAAGGGAFDKLNGLTPQFFALFALGALAVQLGSGDKAAPRRRPLGVVALAAFLGFVLVAITQRSESVVAHFFWMDLVFGLGVACLLARMHAGGSAPARGLLASRPALWLGLFSYSIYLVHAPLVGVLNKYAFAPMDLSPLAKFGLMLAVGLPVILACCYGFHLLFEAPFLRRRDLSALTKLPILRRLPGARTPRGGPAAAPAAEPSGRGVVPAPAPAAGERAVG
jgi:peptidoglycan/LPS O-acetylase OafA/YrhL